MELAHDLLQAQGGPEMRFILGERTVTEFLGELWVKRHPAVKPAIRSVEEALSNEHAHGNPAAS